MFDIFEAKILWELYDDMLIRNYKFKALEVAKRFAILACDRETKVNLLRFQMYSPCLGWDLQE